MSDNSVGTVPLVARRLVDEVVFLSSNPSTSTFLAVCDSGCVVFPMTTSSKPFSFAVVGERRSIRKAQCVASCWDGEYVVVVNGDGHCIIFSLLSKSSLYSLTARRGSFTFAQFVESTHLLLLACSDGTIAKWQIGQKLAAEVETVPLIHEKGVLMFCHRRVLLLSLTEDGIVHLWNSETGMPISRVVPKFIRREDFSKNVQSLSRRSVSWKGHTGHIQWCSIGQKKNLLCTAGEDGLVSVWSTEVETYAKKGSASDMAKKLSMLETTGSQLQLVSSLHHEAACTTCDFVCDDENVLTCSIDSTVRIFSIQGTPLFQINGFPGSVRVSVDHVHNSFMACWCRWSICFAIVRPVPSSDDAVRRVVDEDFAFILQQRQRVLREGLRPSVLPILLAQSWISVKHLVDGVCSFFAVPPTQFRSSARKVGWSDMDILRTVSKLSLPQTRQLILGALSTTVSKGGAVIGPEHSGNFVLKSETIDDAFQEAVMFSTNPDHAASALTVNLWTSNFDRNRNRGKMLN